MDALKAAVELGLAEKGVSFAATEAFGTPRRLILSVTGVADREPDDTKTSRGPSVQAAYGSDGSPSKALEGFCRGQGVDPGQVRNDGEYVWVDKHVAGRPVAEMFAELLPQALASLTFDKTMRWGSNKLRFVRPVRWIVALLDGKVAPMEFAGVASGNLSRGHRADFPEPFPVTDLASLVDGLRSRNVEPCSAARRSRVESQAQAVASGQPDLSEALVDENTFLTEWPTAHEGSFDPKYLQLPECVLVTAMAKHERFFPVRDGNGKLAAKFVSIRNAGDEATVRAGNEWVLNARFNDAKFFYDQDKSKTMDEFLALTDRMLFQEKLGTVRERAERLANLAGQVAEATGASPEETEWAKKAGLYAKADLSAGLVSELASLQGKIGAEYARREGFPEPVCTALACQYDLGSVKGGGPEAKTAVRLIVADQLDKLAGFLGSGHVPKGSSDPFGLRRCATTLIEAARWWPEAAPGYSALFELALAAYDGLDAPGARSALQDLFLGRYEAMTDARHDVLAGAVETAEFDVVVDPRLVGLRLTAVGSLAGDAVVVQTATRPLNILNSHRAKGGEIASVFDKSMLDSADGVALAGALVTAQKDMAKALAAEDASLAAQVVRDLCPSINAFFDSTMVMAEDLTVREHRLALLAQVEAVLLQVGDFTKIVAG